MLIKSADDRSGDIAELRTLANESELTPLQKKRIEQELYNLEKGAWGEETAAYFLNFHFASSENHLLLHDLRLHLTDGRTAQIDHLLINRFLDFYVLESKNWQQLTVDQAGNCTTWAGKIIGVESPLEQCRRHVDVLAIALQTSPRLKELAPRYEMFPRVLVAPRCHLKAPAHQEYVKADAFYSVRAKEIDNESTLKSLWALPRFSSKSTLAKLGEALLELHQQSTRDWRARFGLPAVTPQETLPANSIVSSIPGLSEYVPRWGTDWFVLQGRPTEETKKAIRTAGYRAKQEKGEWVWRLKP